MSKRENLRRSILKKPGLSKNNYIIIGISLCSFVFLLSVVLNLFPMGIPGQWIYPYNSQGMLSLNHIIFGGLVFAAICVLVAKLYSKESASTQSKFVLLFIIISGSVVFDIQVLKSGKMGMGENLFAIYDPFATGYYQKALSISSTNDFLGKFHQNQAYTGFINHINVHPPGRTLMSYYIYKTVENVPGLTALLLKSMPEDMRDAYRLIKNNNLFPMFKLTDEVKAAAILHIYFFLLILLLSKFLFALAVWKAYGVDCSVQTSVLYLFVPTCLLFLGHYDGLLACCSAFIILYALWQPKTKYLFLSNIILGICCSLFILQSVAIAIPCLWLVFFWLSRDTQQTEKNHFNYVFVNYFIPYALGILLFIVFMFICFDFLLPRVLFSCLHNNEMFFKNQSSRTIIWKLLNPVEFLIGTGLSGFFLLLVWAYDYFKSISWRTLPKRFPLSDQHALELASCACLAVLLFSPTRAEVARQWSLAWPFVYILVIKACQYYQFKFYQIAILGVGLVVQIFIFRFFLEIVLMHT